MKTRFLLNLLSMSLLSLSQLRAQEGKNGNVSVEFSIIGWGDLPGGLYFRNAGKNEFPDIQAFKRSAVYKYTGSASMPLFWSASEAINKQNERLKALESLGEDGLVTAAKKSMSKITTTTTEEDESKKPPVGFVEFPPATHRATVLLSHAGEGKYRAVVINDDAGNFPVGSIRMINMTQRRIGIRLDKKDQIVLPPKEVRIVNPGKPTPFVQIAFEKTEINRWVMLKETRIRAPEDHQTTVFFLQSDESDFKTLDGQKVDPIQSFTVYDSAKSN